MKEDRKRGGKEGTDEKRKKNSGDKEMKKSWWDGKGEKGNVGVKEDESRKGDEKERKKGLRAKSEHRK